MSSPSGGVAGPSYSDGDIRHMIRVINATPSTGGQTSFALEKTKLRKYYGILGQYYPEPGLHNYAHALGVADDASLRAEVMNEIEENYTLATGGGGTILPPSDPGAAQPGFGKAHPTPSIGGTNPFSDKSPGSIGFGSVVDALNALKPFIDFIANPVRVGELILGVVVVGVAFNAVMRQGFGANAPQIPGPRKIAKAIPGPAKFAAPGSASKAFKGGAK